MFKLAFDASHEGAKLSVGQERRTREFTTGHGAVAARQPQGTGWCSGILQPADSVAPRAEAQRAPTAPRQSGLFVCHGVLKYRSIFGDSFRRNVTPATFCASWARSVSWLLLERLWNAHVQVRLPMRRSPTLHSCTSLSSTMRTVLITESVGSTCQSRSRIRAKRIGDRRPRASRRISLVHKVQSRAAVTWKGPSPIAQRSSGASRLMKRGASGAQSCSSRYECRGRKNGC